MKQIKLAGDTIDQTDINSLIEWLKTNPRLTKGELTKQLEEEYAKWQGCKHSLFVNSGSSANLLMLYALKHDNRYKHIKKVAIPAISWSTDLAPIIQLGFEPVLLDVSTDVLATPSAVLEMACVNPETRPDVFLNVHILGFSFDLNSVKTVCKKYNVILLEDCCEAMGSKNMGKKVGNFGLMSSFSTYFGHHISTIEGGFICTNDTHLYNILLSLRSHGWTRDMDISYRDYHQQKWSISDFNYSYSFIYPGFNLRSTDLQAFIGLQQLKKLNKICDIRNKNYIYYNEQFINILNSKFFESERDYTFSLFVQLKNTFNSNFAFPIKARTFELRDKMTTSLQKQGVECRPLICGSMDRQPMFIEKYGFYTATDLRDSHTINDIGFYLPNHADLTQSDIDYIVKIIKDIK